MIKSPTNSSHAFGNSCFIFLRLLIIFRKIQHCYINFINLHDLSGRSKYVSFNFSTIQRIQKQSKTNTLWTWLLDLSSNCWHLIVSINDKADLKKKNHTFLSVSGSICCSLYRISYLTCPLNFFYYFCTFKMCFLICFITIWSCSLLILAGFSFIFMLWLLYVLLCVLYLHFLMY